MFSNKAKIAFTLFQTNLFSIKQALNIPEEDEMIYTT